MLLFLLFQYNFSVYLLWTSVVLHYEPVGAALTLVFRRRTCPFPQFTRPFLINFLRLLYFNHRYMCDRKVPRRLVRQALGTPLRETVCVALRDMEDGHIWASNMHEAMLYAYRDDIQHKLDSRHRH